MPGDRRSLQAAAAGGGARGRATGAGPVRADRRGLGPRRRDRPAQRHRARPHRGRRRAGRRGRPPQGGAASRAEDRATYLRRPDLGRSLAPESRDALAAAAGEPCDLALLVADGLSARAIHENAVPVIEAFRPHAEKAGWRLAPVVVAGQARVALGDAVGEALRARAVAVLIGERPGLSSPDSLGIYLTFGPRPGRSDAERNCISNVRAAGLAPDAAAFKLAWLIGQALSRGLTGVHLKDESDRALEAPDLRAARVQG
ncbi:ethanolamine ammonia-lyase [Methylobacterium hispanicum]